VLEKGHLQVNKNTLINLTDLHKQLMFSQDHLDYSSSFHKALPFLTELRAKQNIQEESDIEVAFTFLYGILMLKLQRKEITPETKKAQEIISKLVAVLSAKYKLQQEGKLQLDLD
jgi:flagellin-specific chaperone FliS